MDIISVTTDDEVAAAKNLIYEFIDWLHERYPDMSQLIADYFSSQGFDDEMANLLAVFGPPRGACLLARDGDEPVGILMMKPHGETEVEMNRMFVRENARGKGYRTRAGQPFDRRGARDRLSENDPVRARPPFRGATALFQPWVCR